MKAITFHQYGPPEILELSDVEKPTPGDHEVLIRVKAASVNPLDWHIMRGKPWIARLSSGLNKPKIPFLGADVAGTVEMVGSRVTAFKAGDEVFGGPEGTVNLGSFAEYVCFPEQTLVKKTEHLSFEEAAAVPIAAITALQSLQHGRIQSGQQVLINGASGGVGTFTVQLAKAFGAEVTGICSTRNLDMVRSLGADHVIDYTKEDFAEMSRKYDLLVDNVGNRTVATQQSVLKPTGKCVIVGYTSPGLLMQHLILGPFISIGRKQKIGPMKTAHLNKQDLSELRDMLEKGQIKPIIDKSYSLAETPQAVAYLETGHARGKVVIRVPY